MTSRVLCGADLFLDLLDFDQRRSGLPGNLVQLILHLESMPGRDIVEQRIAEWVTTEPACRIAIKRSLWRLPRWCLLSKPVMPRVNWHRAVEPTTILDQRINSTIPHSNFPAFAIDIIALEGGGAVLALTWHHLLTDAHGGEFLLSRLSDPSPTHTGYLPAADNSSLLSRIKKARQFRPAVRQMALGGVTSPGRGKLKGPFRLASTFRVIRSEAMPALSKRSHRVHPIFGETALLLAASLRRINILCQGHDKRCGGYLVPVPVSRRLPGKHTPILGNPVSFFFIYIKKSRIEGYDMDTLARDIACSFVEQARNDFPSAVDAALSLSKHFPKPFYRWLLRRTMQGELASCFFANTGPVNLRKSPGGNYNFLGVPVTACFHRPMVCQPPGVGLFACRYLGRLHLTICWIEGVLKRGIMETAANNLVDELVNGQ